MSGVFFCHYLSVRQCMLLGVMEFVMRMFGIIDTDVSVIRCWMFLRVV